MIAQLKFARGIFILVIGLFILLPVDGIPSAAQTTTPEPEPSVRAKPCPEHAIRGKGKDAGPPGVFSEAPTDPMDYLSPAHPEMSAPAASEIAVIETNAPTYRIPADERPRQERFDWVSFLVTLEYLRVNEPVAAIRPGWYEFIAAKAPMLSQEQTDAIARDWWQVMGEKASVFTGTFARSGTWEEVRAQFRVLRTGTQEEVAAAKSWLIYAGSPTAGNNLMLPEEVRGTSPLAVLLANDISEESRIYAGLQSEKLRTVVECLIAGKFDVPAPAPGRPDATRRISVQDVDRLLAQVSSDDASLAHDARNLLEEWLKKALETDLKRPPNPRGAPR